LWGQQGRGGGDAGDGLNRERDSIIDKTRGDEDETLNDHLTFRKKGVGAANSGRKKEGPKKRRSSRLFTPRLRYSFKTIFALQNERPGNTVHVVKGNDFQVKKTRKGDDRCSQKGERRSETSGADLGQFKRSWFTLT